MVKSKKKINEDYELWKGRIADKEKQIETLEEKKGFKKYKKFYNGDYESALDLKIPVIVVNEVYAFVRTAVSILFARNPKIKCNPQRTQDFIPAKISEIAVNYYWRIKKIKRQVKKAIKEAKLCGYSFMKVGYEADIEELSDMVEEPNEFIKDEDLYAIYVPYDRIGYDSDAQDPPYDCTWMYHKYLRPTEVLRKKYKDESIQPSAKIDSKSNMLKETDRERTWVFQIWDKDDNKVKTYIEGLNDFVEVKSWGRGYIGFPFVMLNFDEMIDLGCGDNIPESEIKAFEPQILEKIKLRSLQMEHIKRYNRQLLADKTKIGEEEKQKLLRGDIAAVIEVDGDPTTAISAVPYPQIQADAYQVEARINLDMTNISGQTSNDRGAPAQTQTRTLGELEAQNAGAAGRSAEQQDIVEDFTEQIATKLIQQMRANFTSERYAQISGEIDRTIYDMLKKSEQLDGMSIKYTNKDLEGMYDVSIVAGSTLPLNPAGIMNNLTTIAKFGQAFGLTPGSMATMQLGKLVMDNMELLEMKSAYDIDINRALEPQEPSPQEKMKMMQMQQNLQKGQKQIETADNRMASNTQSTIKKALDNAKIMKGEHEQMDMAQKKMNLAKSAKDLTKPEPKPGNASSK